PSTVTSARPSSTTKKPAPPAPSWVTLSPAANRLSCIESAICFSSRSSRSAKSGTFFSISADALATAELYTGTRPVGISQDMTVKLTVIVCSPAWNNPGGAQSGYLVEGGGRLLLDCGPGVLARLRAREGWPRIDALAITHFHLDHWGDLVPWVFGASFGPGRKVPRPALWLPPGGAGTLRAFGQRLGFADQIDRAFVLEE